MPSTSQRLTQQQTHSRLPELTIVHEVYDCPKTVVRVAIKLDEVTSGWVTLQQTLQTEKLKSNSIMISIKKFLLND